jgi:23S rRNA (guanosine2251-2'-O)-methyltransferase
MSERERPDLLIGVHAVESALRAAPERLTSITVAAECRNPRIRKLQDQAQSRGLPVRTESRSVLDLRSDGQRHQDIIAEFEAANRFNEKDLPALLEAIDGPPFLLVLDGVQDPHNLGACLRTAEAAGVHLVILPKDRAAGLTPAVRRAASGAAEVIPLLFATNLARVLRRLKESGVWLAGTSDRAAQSLFEVDLSGPLAIVLGSEGQGMRRLTAELCDFQLAIPVQGAVNSLNVSVAAAVCLYEALRQRSAS